MRDTFPCSARLFSSHTEIRSVSAQHPPGEKFSQGSGRKNLFTGETDFLNCGQRKALSRVRDFSHAHMQAAFSDARREIALPAETLASKYRLIEAEPAAASAARFIFGG